MGDYRDVEVFAEDGTQLVFAFGNGDSETRAERIARFEKLGEIDPDCAYCQRTFYAHPTLDPFAPRHKTGASCRSGGHPHCTCPTCWG